MEVNGFAREGIQTQPLQRNQPICRGDWHIKPLEFYKNNQLHVCFIRLAATNKLGLDRTAKGRTRNSQNRLWLCPHGSPLLWKSLRCSATSCSVRVFRLAPYNSRRCPVPNIQEC